MLVHYNIEIPAHIATDAARLKAVTDRVLPSPLPPDLSIECRTARGIFFRFSINHPDATSAFHAIKNALNLGPIS